MSTSRKGRRFYWVEGVTASEIEASLDDRRPSRLRQQRWRRALVLALGAAVLALSLTSFLEDVKPRTYLEAPLLVLAVVLYLRLRFATRKLPDAPDDLLDERQVAVRNAAYIHAYRLFAVAVLVWGFAVLNLLPQDPQRSVIGLVMALCTLAAALPSMVLAWSLPSEEPGPDPAA